RDERASADRALQQSFLAQLVVHLFHHAARDTVVHRRETSGRQTLPGRKDAVENGAAKRSMEVAPAHTFPEHGRERGASRSTHVPLLEWVQKRILYRIFPSDPAERDISPGAASSSRSLEVHDEGFDAGGRARTHALGLVLCLRVPSFDLGRLPEGPRGG